MMLTKDKVIEMITQGKNLILAGDEEALKDLPQGSWIGGTIPYFMTEDGGLSTTDKIFVTELPDCTEDLSIVTYSIDTIAKVYLEAPENGFSLIIIPAQSQIHQYFALKAPTFTAFGARPLIGWISGVDLKNIGKQTAKVFDGTAGTMLEDQAIVMHVSLPKEKFANIGIVNIFEQGDGGVIEFKEDGFVHDEVFVNGTKIDFVEYIEQNNIDTKLPLVADYLGIMVNVSFQEVNEEENKVSFYAPVFKGIKYRQAKSVGDYVSTFTSKIPTDADKIVFSCNCILNYLYSELEGKKTGSIVGPITFGEIAYQLLNQTLVYLTVQDIVYDDEDEDNPSEE